MRVGVLLKVDVTCVAHSQIILCFVLFTGEIRNLAQIIQPPGYSLWLHCIENIYANVITEMRFSQLCCDLYGTVRVE